MKLIYTLTLVSSLLFTSVSFACPDLNDVDLANGDRKNPVFFELDRTPVYLSRSEFKVVPGYAEMEYQACKKALVLQKLQVKKNKKIFYALLTTEDTCDGGNSVGALISADRKQLVGDISDSFISCFKKPISLNLSGKK